MTSPAAVDRSAARERLLEERDRLEALRGSLIEEVSSRDDGTAGLAEASTAEDHPADVGSETFERQKGLSILEQVQAQLRDIDRAVARVEDGTYGRCEACKEPIGAARLEARPFTRYCLDDQRAFEGASASSG